jgi:hypothetical protein
MHSGHRRLACMQPQLPACQTVLCECFVSNTTIWQKGMAGALNMSLEYVQARWVWRMLLARAALKSYDEFKDAARDKALTKALIKAIQQVMHL